ncbi:Uncharacterised protein [Legionella steigerwaltii]|uniref:Uncharacterized protein n=1 Tax=Legionella steigerwaltii TaxID=460 RepID=A0A378LBI4_9GAMM|nr:lpg0008 family Dot/Icm T4SS effector [Legionella steigerwaltii]KTD79458.1 hypothetical protein Lstg_0674 [Legionella steigerwaltii]STY21441.1 Uncharacterised protein [Legionella steigerwaltii]
MAFTYEQIIALENPYEQLSNSDALAENAKVLDALNSKEQIAMATKIIAACPEAKFKQYGHHIKALDSLTKREGAFHDVITEAYQVRQRINSLLDPRNKSPHALFLAKEFNPAPFHQFSALTKQVLESNESAIAERLALCAPKQDRSQIAHNLGIAFPKSVLTEKIHHAFMLRGNIERLLLSDNPEKFFTSRDYNADTCKMFANMFRTLLNGHEESVGEKLCALESTSLSAIKRELDLLHTEAFDETSPFKLIADAISAKESSVQKKNGSQASNPNGFLYKRSPTPPLSVKSLSLEQFESGSREADDEKELSHGESSEKEEEEDVEESYFTPF